MPLTVFDTKSVPALGLAHGRPMQPGTISEYVLGPALLPPERPNLRPYVLLEGLHQQQFGAPSLFLTIPGTATAACASSARTRTPRPQVRTAELVGRVDFRSKTADFYSCSFSSICVPQGSVMNAIPTPVAVLPYGRSSFIPLASRFLQNASRCLTSKPM